MTPGSDKQFPQVLGAVLKSIMYLALSGFKEFIASRKFPIDLNSQPVTWLSQLLIYLSELNQSIPGMLSSEYLRKIIFLKLPAIIS